jgi:hypothetical protein
MAVNVIPGSAKIRVMQVPKANTPVVPFTGTALSGGAPTGESARDFAGFTCTGIGLGGEVSLTGDPAAIAACTLGFIQLQWIETYWLHYRGKTSADGSMLVQLGRPPARPQQVCRDVVKTSLSRSRIWCNVDDNGKASDTTKTPVKIAAVMDDEPFETAMLRQINGKTGKANLLHEAQIERHFCAVLSLQDGDAKFLHLASRYWNVRWQAVFNPTDPDDHRKGWRVVPIAKGIGAAVSHTIPGSPTDPRFAQQVTELNTPICNVMLKRAHDMVDNYTVDKVGKILVNGAFNPETRRESAVWSNFDVRK